MAQRDLGMSEAGRPGNGAEVSGNEAGVLGMRQGSLGSGNEAGEI